MPSGDRILPFLKQFHSSPSTCIWEDDMGTQHEVTQGEGEQGDPLMPMLFCLGQHGALAAIEGRLKAGEKLFAFLDDVYLICQPDRVQDVHRILEEELRTRVGIRVHHGKTQIWNRSGCPKGSGRDDQNSQEDCRSVERRPEFASWTTRDPSVGSAHRSGGVHQEPFGQEV